MNSWIGLLILSGLLALAMQARANDSSHGGRSGERWDRWGVEPDPVAFPVLQYLESGEASAATTTDPLVIIEAGRHSGLSKGVILKTYRSSAPPQLLNSTGQQGSDRQVDSGLWVQTGLIRTLDVQLHYTIAQVIKDQTATAATVFPRFPRMMAGDLAVAQNVAIARKQIITPTVTLSYFKLFADPKPMPSSFELSPAGLAALAKAAQPFQHAHLSLLMIEGYTDHRGNTRANQVESYQRALTIRQYLIDRFGFDPDRVVAIGYGESEQIDGNVAPGYVQANRRIVLKAVPLAARR